IVHLVGLRQDAPSIGGRGNQHFAAGEPGNAEDFLAGGRARATPARPPAPLPPALRTQTPGPTPAPHSPPPGRRCFAFLLRRDVASGTRIEAHRGDDLLAVLQLEEPLNRFAVAG